MGDYLHNIVYLCVGPILILNYFVLVLLCFLMEAVLVSSQASFIQSGYSTNTELGTFCPIGHEQYEQRLQRSLSSVSVCVLD